MQPRIQVVRTGLVTSTAEHVSASAAAHVFYVKKGLRRTAFYRVNDIRSPDAQPLELIGEFQTETPHDIFPLTKGLTSVTTVSAVAIHEIAPGFAEVAHMSIGQHLAAYAQGPTNRALILDIQGITPDGGNIVLYSPALHTFSYSHIRCDHIIMYDIKRVMYQCGDTIYMWTPKWTIALDVFGAFGVAPRELTQDDLVLCPHDKMTYIVLHGCMGALKLDRKTGALTRVWPEYIITGEMAYLDNATLMVTQDGRIMHLETGEDLTDDLYLAATGTRNPIPFSFSTRFNAIVVNNLIMQLASLAA